MNAILETYRYGHIVIINASLGSVDIFCVVCGIHLKGARDSLLMQNKRRFAKENLGLITPPDPDVEIKASLGPIATDPS